MVSRNEEEMFNLILNTAKNDENIRVVMMNGSRAIKNVRKDCFQDYDITFVVTDVRNYVNHTDWISIFGELMILQTPTDWHSHPYDYESNKPFTYLMQFIDGTRIDLTLCTVEDLDDEGEPMVILLDKDNKLPSFKEPTDEVYFVNAPAEKEFYDCCNEFWWLCPYIAKELWRNALPLAKVVLEQYIRNEFMKMLEWFIGIQYDFNVYLGKKSKNIKEFLSESDWETFKKTYSDLEKENMWTSLFVMSDMFREKALQVSKNFGYDYPYREDKKVTEFIKHIQLLPEEVTSIY